MSSKIKKWIFGKLFISNGAKCSGCIKPNSTDIIEPKPKIPIHTNPLIPNICHTCSSSCEINGTHVHSKDDDDFDQDDHTSTTFSIDIGSLSPPSSCQNDGINLSQSNANSESRIGPCLKIGDTFVLVKNLDDPFQDNQTSTPFSIINMDSTSPPSPQRNDFTNLSQSKTNSSFKGSTCPKISDTLVIVKNLDDPFQENNHTSTTFSFRTKSLSPPISDQNRCTNNSKANSEFRVDSCSKISGALQVAINSDDPLQDFKKSMIQMIIEREIYSDEDLEELLNCFIKLNSPSHHYIIIQAFMEILNNNVMVVSERSGKMKQSL